MASVVDICNLALAHLGDEATVTSISPPEGSAQSQHCARFYPIARNTLLEMAYWGFATIRATLAEVDNEWAQWQHAYAMPTGVISVISVLSPAATDDYSEGFASTNSQSCVDAGALGTAVYTPQDYTIELNADGQQVILTNVEDAILRYTMIVEDSNRFSPLFVEALSWKLASMLAGPLIKGDVGAAEAKRCLAIFQGFELAAKASDANQRHTNVRQATPWIAGR
jgi:hypothetical protein